MIKAYGAFLGLVAVIMGAYVDHGLMATTEQMQSMETAIRFNGYYALVVLLLAFMADFYESKWLTYINIGFALAASIFILGIYLSVIFMLPSFVYLTPVGGSLLIVLWGVLLITFILNKSLYKKG